jgi:coenzyme F420-reducing hydrogenase gamma subunit
MPAKKLRVGIFSFTADEGCVIQFLEILNYKFFDWVEKVEFRNARVLKSGNEITPLDVAFIEGAISNHKEEGKLKAIRAASKKVVAIGSCAINGSPSNHRNFFDEKTTEEIQPVLEHFGHRSTVVPIHELVKVDDQVPGCPIIEQAFVEVMEKYIKEFGVVP